ncbi:MAG TPA: CCA tRNA nucleotidyltransferase [Xanthobacteraceae bacterium]|nr:CCA tRNA nucleotidyltransferase [Xanthobacteraceae bacterium]
MSGPLPDPAPLLRTYPGLAALLAALDGAGEETRLVGGAVRDWLLGLEGRSDVDLATTAVPEEVVRRAEAAGFKTVPTGIAHGTVTVIAAGVPFEVTTLREDVATDGRRAVVRFGRDWAHDAARRDFTMNALYLTRGGELVDPVGGVPDALAGLVRFIGDPDQRIREDYLRILRLFRFHGSHGRGPLDAAALAAAVRQRAGLAGLSRERVRAEFVKLLVAPRAAETLAAMDAAGVLADVLGSPGDIAAAMRLCALEAGLDLAPDPLRRLAALAVRGEGDTARLREGLRLTNAEAKRLERLTDRRLELAPDLTDLERCAALYHLGLEGYRDRVLFDFARSGADVDDGGWRDLVRLPELWTPPVFPINAGAFLARGLPQGPAIGAALRRTEALWIERGFPEDPMALLMLVRDGMEG